jgi:hypothetical protein
MFYLGEWSSQIIFCLLDDLYNDFGAVDEAMFQGFNKLTFSILGIEKSDLDEVA